MCTIIRSDFLQNALLLLYALYTIYANYNTYCMYVDSKLNIYVLPAIYV